MSTLKVDEHERYPTCLWASVAGALLGSFQFGFSVAVLNTALPFIAKDLHYHKDALLSSSVVLGAAVGALLAGKLADYLGPRHAQVANCLAFLIGALAAAGSTSHRVFLLGRFVSGTGAGAASLYVPRYIAEVSPPALRGWLGSLNQVMINAGILAAYCAGIPYEAGFTGFDVLGGVWLSWWRVMNALVILPAVLQVMVLSACPESPVWLEGQGKKDAADEACIRLWGARAILPDPDEGEAAQAANLVNSASGWGVRSSRPNAGTGGSGFSGGSLAAPLLQRQQPSRVLDGGGMQRGSVGIASSSGFGGGFEGSSDGRGLGIGARGVLDGWEGLLARRYRLMMALAVGLPLLQQASGINTVVYYSSKVFSSAGLSSPIAASIITGGVNLAVTLVAAAVLDRYGRKPLLLVSYVGMAVALAAVAGLALLPVPPATAGMVMVVLVLLYVAAFAIGSGPVTWVVLSEVLPPQIKGPAASLATAASWTGNLVVTLSFDGLLAHVGLGGTYALYAAFNVAAAVYVAELLVETRCRSLQEIEELLLLSDTDPRLVALLPALQQLGSAGSDGGAAGAGAVSAGLGGGSPSHAPTGFSGGGGIVAQPSYGGAVPAGVMRQHQQRHWMAQPAALGATVGGHIYHPSSAAAGGPAMSPFYRLNGADGAAGVDAAAGDPAGPFLGGVRSALLVPPSAAAAAGIDDVVLQQKLLPTALPAGMPSTQDDMMLSRQEYVAGWAAGAAEAAAAEAAAAAAAAAAAGGAGVGPPAVQQDLGAVTVAAADFSLDADDQSIDAGSSVADTGSFQMSAPHEAQHHAEHVAQQPGDRSDSAGLGAAALAFAGTAVRTSRSTSAGAAPVVITGFVVQPGSQPPGAS